MTASAILAALDRALPIDGSEEGLAAVAAALEAYAELTEQNEPYATVSIARYRQSADLVRSLWDRLAADQEAGQ